MARGFRKASRFILPLLVSMVLLSMPASAAAQATGPTARPTATATPQASKTITPAPKATPQATRPAAQATATPPRPTATPSPTPPPVTSSDGEMSAAAELDTPPWSGWWWPASADLGPTLFAPDSPLDKYDRYMAMVTGQSAGTRAWEREQLYFPDSLWAGHCNGFAAAALLEPEPTEPVTIFDITFTVADLKGLLVDYHFADAAAWSFGDDGELNPADFHRMLLTWLESGGKGFVLTYDMGNGEVWSYPVYRFDSAWSPDDDDPDLWHVSTTVWMADMDVSVNFVGTKPYPGPAGKTFTYTLRGDPRKPTDGAWAGASQKGRFAHPGRIWYPEAKVRNGDRELVSPGLDRQTLTNIIAGLDGSGIAITSPRP